MPRALLLHGFAGGPESFDAFVRNLGARWACHRPYLPAHGAQPALGPSKDFREGVTDFFQALQAWLDQDSSAVHLVGYSLGARIALGLLEQHPESFLSATLIGLHPGLSTDEARESRRLNDSRWIEVLMRDGMEAFIDAWQAQPLFASQNSLPLIEINRQSAIRRANEAHALAWSFSTFGLAEMPNFLDLLKSPPVPIHLITGELDYKFRALADSVARNSTHCRVTTIENGGHNLILEQPKALARAFVEGVEHD